MLMRFVFLAILSFLGKKVKRRCVFGFISQISLLSLEHQTHETTAVLEDVVLFNSKNESETVTHVRRPC